MPLKRSRLRHYAGISEHNGLWLGEAYVFHLRLPRARKQYPCDACAENIVQGERYVHYVTHNLEGPGWEIWRIHGECYLDNVPMFVGERPPWRWEEQHKRHR